MKIEKLDNGRTRYTPTLRYGQLGDMATEWWTEEDWEKWRKQCKKWKEEGLLGKEYQVTIELQDNAELDEPLELPITPTYQFLIFDISNEDKV